MNSNRGRLALVGSTSLALLMAAGTLVAAAEPSTPIVVAPAPAETGVDLGPVDALFGADASGAGTREGQLLLGEQRPFLRLRNRLIEAVRHLVTSQTTLEYDGEFVTRQSAHGTFVSIAGGSITIDLATAVQATTAMAPDAIVVKLGDPTAGTRPERISADDLQSGDEVLVVARQESDGTFLVHRILVLPTEG